MSIGFRIFILIVVAFAALWIYRFREPELQRLFVGFQTQAQERAQFSRNDVAVAHLTRPRQFFPPVDPSSLGSVDWARDGETWDPRDPRLADVPQASDWDPLAELPLEQMPPEEYIPGLEYDADGQVILPDPDLLPTSGEELFEKDLKSGSGNLDRDAKPFSQSVEQRVSPRTHTVAEKETLSRIARKYFPGNSRGVALLFEANKGRLGLSSPHEIFAGQVLVIPDTVPSRTVTRNATTHSE